MCKRSNRLHEVEELLSDTAKLLWRIYGDIHLEVPDLAKVLKYSSKASVHNALHLGRLKGLRIIQVDRRILVDIRDMAEFLDEKRKPKRGPST